MKKKLSIKKFRLTHFKEKIINAFISPWTLLLIIATWFAISDFQQTNSIYDTQKTTEQIRESQVRIADLDKQLTEYKTKVQILSQNQCVLQRQINDLGGESKIPISDLCRSF